MYFNFAWFGWLVDYRIKASCPLVSLGLEWFIITKPLCIQSFTNTSLQGQSQWSGFVPFVFRDCQQIDHAFRIHRQIIRRSQLWDSVRFAPILCKRSIAITDFCTLRVHLPKSKAQEFLPENYKEASQGFIFSTFLKPEKHFPMHFLTAQILEYGQTANFILSFASSYNGNIR